jgi:hypothetical protein
MINEEKIRKEAKAILDRFALALEEVNVGEKKLKKEVGGFRKELGSEDRDDEFRKNLFENAPETEGDCLIAEKKKW